MLRILIYILIRLTRYRWPVIDQNLRNAFPQMSNAELLRLRSAYYSYLSRVLAEIALLPYMSRNTIAQRCTFLNPELLTEARLNGKRVIIMMGHSGNWEMAGLAAKIHTGIQMIPVYRPLSNQSVDAIMKRIRSRFGVLPVEDKHVYHFAVKQPPPWAIALLADHNPPKRGAIWTQFLNQPTPFYKGGEILAKRLDAEVIFAHVRRKKNGFGYEVVLRRCTDTPDTEMFKVTKAFKTFLEEEIKSDPPNWLWSHRRWKHQPGADARWF
ncbi:MAG: lysophospholipid acyltransferase family protein [Salibacteraceae bacterium]